jgi:hypothetical protein
MAGAPVPFIKLTPRIINCVHGPSPSLRGGAFGICAFEQKDSVTRKESSRSFISNDCKDEYRKMLGCADLRMCRSVQM